MKILDNNFIQKALDEFGVYNFDVQASELKIAGHTLMDYIEFTVTPTQKRRTEQGISQNYHTYVNLPNYATISVTVLNGGKDALMLRQMEEYFTENTGAIIIDIVENTVHMGSYRCYLSTDASLTVNESAPDKTYEFVGVKMLGESALTYTNDEMESIEWNT